MIHRCRRITAVIATAAISLLFAPSAVPAQTSPDKATAFVEQLSTEALAVLRSQDGSLAEREAKVKTILREGFDFQVIGRFALGPAWRKASPEQREIYQRLFEQYVLLTYLRRLTSNKDDTFTIIKAVPAGKKDAVVMTEIRRLAGKPIKVGWRVRDNNGKLRILDVIVEGISMLSTQRAEFQSTIKSKGLDGLINALRMRVAGMVGTEQS